MPIVIAPVTPEPRKRFSLHGRMRLYALKKAVQAREATSPLENSPLKIGSTWFETQILHLLG